MKESRNREEQSNQPQEERTGVDPKKKHQQQSDPQITELKGFIDPNEDLEPRLEDGTKAPEKAPE